MDKILAYILVNLVTWNPDKSREIVREFFGGKSVVKPSVSTKISTTTQQQKKTPPKSKRDELLESLDYLKSKKTKTKKDRESIYTLEMILKNMS